MQKLYSTTYYNFGLVPDIGAYIKNREQLANYDFDDLTIKLADAEDFSLLAESVDKFRTSTRIADRTGRGDVCVVAYKPGSPIGPVAATCAWWRTSTARSRTSAGQHGPRCRLKSWVDASYI
jgi:hypothetical protein